MNKSILIAIGGPTGVGESSVTKEVIKKLGKAKRLVTTTTRPPRGKEKNGQDYFFISKPEFKKRIKQGFFLEYTYVKERKQFYGSEKRRINYWLSRGYDVLANIDVVGALAMKKEYGARCLTIFIVPDNFSNLKKRITHRNPDISDTELAARIQHAKNEMKDKKQYDFIVVNAQGKLAQATANAMKIIKKFRKNQPLD